MSLSNNDINYIFPVSLDGLTNIEVDGFKLNTGPGVLESDNNGDVIATYDVDLNSIKSITSSLDIIGGIYANSNSCIGGSKNLSFPLTVYGGGSTQLNVEGPSNVSGRIKNNIGTLELCVADSAGSYSTDAGAGDCIIRSSAFRRLLLQSSSGGSAICINGLNNRVGIFTPSPGHRLDVQGGDINTSGIYRVAGNQISTSNVLEGSNLYFTDARARNALSISNPTNSGVVLSYNNSTGVFSASADNTVVRTTNITQQIDGFKGFTKNCAFGNQIAPAQFPIECFGTIAVGDADFLTYSFGSTTSFGYRISHQGQTTKTGLFGDNTSGLGSILWADNQQVLGISSNQINCKKNLNIETGSNILFNNNAISTSNIPEGSNLYYTDSRARSALTTNNTNQTVAITYNNSMGIFSASANLNPTGGIVANGTGQLSVSPSYIQGNISINNISGSGAFLTYTSGVLSAATDSTVVRTSGNQTIGGQKTFNDSSTSPIIIDNGTNASLRIARSGSALLECSVAGNNGAWCTDAVTNDGIIRTPITQSLHVLNGSAEACFTVKNNRLGIRDTNPLVPFSVNTEAHIRQPMQLFAATSTYSQSTVDLANRTNTYFTFLPQSGGNDWSYLRDIGTANAYHLAWDFHDDNDDVRFSLRAVQSTASPSDLITTRFTVQNARTGINTDTPTQTLDVVDPTAPVIRVGTGGAGSLGALWFGNNNHFIGRDASNNITLQTAGTGAGLRFGTNGTEQMRISQVGWISIGSQNNATTNLQVHQRDSTSGVGILLTDSGTGTSTTDGCEIFMGNSADRTLYLINNENVNSNGIQMWCNDSGGTLREHVRLTQNGQFLIGTNSDTGFNSRLHIVGRNLSSGEPIVSINNHANSARLLLRDEGPSNKPCGIASGTGNGLGLYAEGSGGSVSMWTTPAGGYANLTKRLEVNTQGKLFHYSDSEFQGNMKITGDLDLVGKIKGITMVPNQVLSVAALTGGVFTYNSANFTKSSSNSKIMVWTDGSFYRINNAGMNNVEVILRNAADTTTYYNGVFQFYFNNAAVHHSFGFCRTIPVNDLSNNPIPSGSYFIRVTFTGANVALNADDSLTVNILEMPA